MKLKRLSLFLALVMILSAFAGTFTISSAATTDGGTFEIWRGGELYATVTGKITAQQLQDNDVIVLKSDYVVATEKTEEERKFYTQITINGDSTGDGKADHTITISTRWFNLGDSADATKSDGKSVTFKNLNFVMTGVCDGMVQANNQNGKIYVDNCTIEDYSTKGRGFIIAKANQTLEFTNSTLKRYTGGSENAVGHFLLGASTGGTLTVTDSQFYAYGFRAAGSNAKAFIDPAGANLTLNVTRVIMDASEAEYLRLIHGGATGQTWNLTDSLFIASSDSHDHFQTTEAVTFNIVDTVFVGGGDNNTGDVLIRKGTGNGAIGFYSASDPYHHIKIVGRSANYTDDLALLKRFGMDPTVTDNNYDAAAQKMGYKFRLTDAATAYANGKFSGYYTSFKDVTDVMTKTVTESKDIVILNNFRYGSTFTVNMQNANYKFNLTGVQKADGTYPTVWATSSLFSFTYGNTNGTFSKSNPDGDFDTLVTPGTEITAGNLGTTTVSNLNIISSGANITQINTGTLIFDNCYIDQRTSTFGFILNGSDAKVYQQDANRIAGSDIYFATLNLVDTTVKQTSGACSMMRFNADYVVANIDNSKLISSTTTGTIHMVDNGVLNIVNNSEFIIAGKTPFVFADGTTLTLNGKAVTSSITAGKMLEGASVRVARAEAGQEELSNSGIRFESTLTAAQVEAANASGATVEYGTVIFRYEDLDGMSVAELVAAANADAEDDLKVAAIPAVNGKIGSDVDGYTIRAALVNIKENHYNMQFGAVAYIKLTYTNDRVVYIYGNFDATKNVRSIKGVAELALDDTKTQAEIDENGSATFDGYVYHNEIEPGVFSCYSDEQIAILKTYAGVQ